MPRPLVVRTLLVAALAATAACAARTPGEPARATTPDAAGGVATGGRVDTLSVRFGQTVEPQRTGLRVTFRKLVADSRCPIDAICVWEGDAEVALRLERNGATRELTLHTNDRPGPSTVVFEGYDLRLVGLLPARHAGKDAPPESELVALVTVRAALRAAAISN